MQRNHSDMFKLDDKKRENRKTKQTKIQKKFKF